MNCALCNSVFKPKPCDYCYQYFCGKHQDHLDFCQQVLDKVYQITNKNAYIKIVQQQTMALFNKNFIRLYDILIEKLLFIRDNFSNNTQIIEILQDEISACGAIYGKKINSKITSKINYYKHLQAIISRKQCQAPMLKNDKYLEFICLNNINNCIFNQNISSAKRQLQIFKTNQQNKIFSFFLVFTKNQLKLNDENISFPKITDLENNIHFRASKQNNSVIFLISYLLFKKCTNLLYKGQKEPLNTLTLLYKILNEIIVKISIFTDNQTKALILLYIKLSKCIMDNFNQSMKLNVFNMEKEIQKLIQQFSCQKTKYQPLSVVYHEYQSEFIILNDLQEIEGHFNTFQLQQQLFPEQTKQIIEEQFIETLRISQLSESRIDESQNLLDSCKEMNQQLKMLIH